MSASFTQAEIDAIEQRTQAIGQEIFAKLDQSRPRPWQRGWWDERMMSWAMSDQSVKIQMFRFIDVLPTLRSSDAVVRHLQEYFAGVSDNLPLFAHAALMSLSPDSLTAKTLARITRASAQNQARRFIAGTTVPEVLRSAARERQKKRAFTLDILGEAVTSDVEAERYFAAYCELIEGVSPAVNKWEEVPLLDRDADGPIPRANISVKLSALDSRADEIDPAGSLQRIAHRLRELLRLAAQQKAFINVDMESYHLKDLTLHIFKQVLMEKEFRSTSDVGIVIQCYLHDAEQDLHDLAEWAKRRGTPVWVRLVKGAYWDYETIHAQAAGWPVPVFEQKWETDANYEVQLRLLLQNQEHLRPAIASHNIRSLAYGIAVAKQREIAKNALEIQMLYGMADPEKDVLANHEYRVRVYMPFGELIPGMAYLVRRLLENTSNDSFLRASFSESVPVEKLLQNPRRQPGSPADDIPSTSATPEEEQMPFWKSFQNEPLLDFAIEENRAAMQHGLKTVRERFGLHYPLQIAGEKIDTPQRIESKNPSHFAEIVGTTASASAEHATHAVEVAADAFGNWSARSAAERAQFLRDAAEVMRRRRFEIAAWEIYECGKSWREADADVCEAIDFCEFYAAGAIALESEHGKNVPGEQNRFVYLPRGVTAVIAPWNFPLAILTGMTAAALATGNTVVIKPAEQSSLVAALLMEIFEEVNLPQGVLSYLPGRGEVVGAALVADPRVALIAFTGSREVGLAIHAKAAEVSRSSSLCVKHVIAEMGGKNAILVDEDADLDEAVLGVVQSAFGFQGQKCSACSRAIVLDSAYDVFLERLIEATRSLQVGPADDPATRVGPVIDAESRDKILKYVEIGKAESRQVLAMDVPALAEQGYFVGPHIFADVEPEARIAQEEIFGPVLAVMRVQTLEEAIRVANGTEYALTGGIYSRSPKNLERAAREIKVGNLYLNRGCTGALVGRQPFGGFKMSGLGSKAGGAEYLLQFVVPKTITENTMRRGFAPSAGD